MSKIAVNEKQDGHVLRKAIDYFCHLATAPEYSNSIEKSDPAFAASEFRLNIRWLKGTTDDLYDPTYTDMLRVAFTSQCERENSVIWWRCYPVETSRPGSTRKQLSNSLSQRCAKALRPS